MLISPFNGTAFGTFNWQFLASVQNAIPLKTSFGYNTSGEMTSTTFPYGGSLGWGYGSFNYSGTRTLREVNAGRTLKMSATASTLTYNLSFSTAPNSTFHTFAQLDDPDGNSEKAWAFQTTTGAGFALANYIETRPHHYPNVAGEHVDVPIYSTDSTGNAYISTLYTYEDNGNPTAVEKQTNQTIDQYGNVTQVQLYGYGTSGPGSLLRTYSNTYVTDSNYTTRYIFNRLVTSTVTDGTYTTTLAHNYYDNDSFGNTACGAYTLTAITSNEHDNTNYPTTFMYRGNPHYIVTPGGTKCLSYDAGGNLLTHNNNGLTTSATVDSSTNYAAPTKVTTNMLSGNMSYSPALGLKSASGPNGDTASIDYDTNNRPSTSTSPDGAQTAYTYVDPTSPGTHTKTATTNGHWVRTSMDGFGRTIKTETGNGTTTVSTVDTQYVSCGCSPIGKMGQVSQPYTGPTVYWTVYHYDGLGRTTSVVAPDGSTTSYAYAANVVTVTDPAGKYKNFYTDALGNLYQVQEPDPNPSTLVSTTYTYDMLNHLTSVTMTRPTGTQQRTFNYVNGATVGIDLLRATNPENGIVNYTYNTDHTLHTKTDAKGQVFTYLYDSYKRLTSIQVGSNTLRTFLYDGNNPDPTFNATNTAGRLVAVQHASFTPQGYVAGVGGNGLSVPSPITFNELYSYTPSGHIVSKRLQVNETFHWYVNGNLQTSLQTLNLDGGYTYDTVGEGKLQTVSYPKTYTWNGTAVVGTAGPSYTMSFDAMSRPSSMVDQSSTTVVNGVSYNPANQMLGISYFGQNETRGYNTMNQMTSLNGITYNFPTSANNNGKISSQVISGETVTYLYDSLNRLQSATSNQGWSETYGYDGFGNLLTKTPTGSAPTLSQSVDPATNRIVGQSYDSNGNQTSSSIGTLAYDPENRLAGFANGSTQYFYDSQNRRIWKGTLSGSTMTQELYFYGANGQKLATYVVVMAANGPGVVMTTGGSNNTLAVYFGGKRVGTTQNGTTTHFVPDRLGSAGSFYPYGEARGTPPQDTVGFATYTHDSATALDYADQRYYASNFGRFMSPDRYTASAGPSRPGSWNHYSYAEQDPTNRADPSGQYFEDCADGSCVPARCSIPSDAFGDAGSNADCPDQEPQQQVVDTAPPPCNLDIGRIYTTLQNLADDILLITSTQDAGITPADLFALQATLSSDVQTELSDPRSFFVGGHFQLDVSLDDVFRDFGSGDPSTNLAYADFLHIFDRHGHGRRYPDPVPTTDPSHNYYLHDHDAGGILDFHFDRYNPYKSFPVGVILHGAVDVVYGHLGLHCLDPAWRM